MRTSDVHESATQEKGRGTDMWSEFDPDAPGAVVCSDARATITDVAHRAGVSIATVSRTLRGAANVSEQTRVKVLQAVDELAYVPSPAASRLASGHTGAIGAIVQFVARWFFAEVVRGAEIVLREAGYDLLLYNVGDPASREHFFTALPLRRRVDAVLAVATSFDSEERAALDRLDVPVVVAGSQIGGEQASVGIDDHELAASSDLTTIAQPVHDKARIAARIALDRLAGLATTTGRTTDPEPQTGDAERASVVVLPTQLIVRGTTGPPRTGDRRLPT